MFGFFACRTAFWLASIISSVAVLIVAGQALTIWSSLSELSSTILVTPKV
jgi:hypothetical protein